MAHHPAVSDDRLGKGMDKTSWNLGVERQLGQLVYGDQIPTHQERVHTILLPDAALCTTCGERDTRMHRIRESGEGARIWDWTRKRIAWILRTDPARIPKGWTLRPQFHIWSPRRHRAVLWILAHMVWFRISGIQTTSAQEYSDVLRRARWKAHQR